MLAIRCFGYPEPVTDAGLRAVRRAVTPLFKAGAITVTRHAYGYRFDGEVSKTIPVRYRLWLDYPAPDEKRRTPALNHRTKNVLSRGEHRTKNGQAWDEKRPTKEEEEDLLQEQVIKVLTSPVPVEGGHATSSQDQHRQQDDEHDLATVTRISARREPPGLFPFGAEHDNPDSPWAAIVMGEHYATTGVLGQVSA